MECIVFRSQRRADAYVYVLDAAALETLPTELKTGLAPWTEALRFELTAERKLARVDASALIEHLKRIGYHLQVPPPHGTPIGDVRNLGRSDAEFQPR